MKRPTFLGGVGIAFLFSFFAAAVFAALTPVLGSYFVLRLLIAGLGLAYVVYLLSRSRERTGRIITLVLWAVIAVATWFMGPPLSLYLVIHVGMLWLIRSLYLYSSALSALADLGLSALSLAAAVWAASQSGSVFLAVWCFFLVQALFTAIPRSMKPKAKSRPGDDESFERAHRAAEAAVRRLTANG